LFVISRNFISRFKSNMSGEKPHKSSRLRVLLRSSHFYFKADNLFPSIPDLEPPTCSFCQGDIVKEGKSAAIRVLWDRPVCSDNSPLPPKINANRQSGDFFGVPGTYKIQYIVEDHAYPKGNIYTGCSFTITLKSKFSSIALHVAAFHLCLCIFDPTYPPCLKLRFKTRSNWTEKQNWKLFPYNSFNRRKIER